MFLGADAVDAMAGIGWELKESVFGEVWVLRLTLKSLSFATPILLSDRG